MREGWEMKKLGEVCEELFAGGDVPKDNFSKTKSRKYNVPIYSNGETNKGLYGYTNIARVLVPSITVSARGTIGYTEKREGTYYPAIRLIVAIPRTEILNLDFLKYVFSGIEFLSNGTSIPQLTVPMIKGYEIPLPPLSEQQQIVSILDKTFAAIDEAKANTEKNLNNAKELFQSQLNKIFSQKGEGWVEKKLGEVCEVKDGTHDSPTYLSEGIPFVTQKNIRPEGLSLENTRFISLIDHDKFYKRSNVAFGDILISMIGANRGMSCLVDSKKTFSIKNLGLVKENEKINQHYLVYFLKTQKATSYVKSFSKGGAQEFIGLTELRKFPIDVAPLKEQQKIVSQLNALSAETKKLEALYQQKLVELEDLKKSILERAFKGELIEKEIAV